MTGLRKYLFDLEACRLDLGAIDEDLRWCHVNAYWPAGRWIDSQQGADLSKPEEDRDKAPLYDFGLGDHASRVALEATGPWLTMVESHLGAGLMLVGVRKQPVVMAPDADSSLPYLLAAVVAQLWRVSQLARVGEPTKFVRDHATAARNATDKCRRGLLRVLERGPRGGAVATAEPQCRICRIRPRADKAGGRCNTCATYFHRNKHERPVDFDDAVKVEPILAKRRRLSRGEGWGAA